MNEDASDARQTTREDDFAATDLIRDKAIKGCIHLDINNRWSIEYLLIACACFNGAINCCLS